MTRIHLLVAYSKLASLYLSSDWESAVKYCDKALEVVAEGGGPVGDREAVWIGTAYLVRGFARAESDQLEDAISDVRLAMDRWDERDSRWLHLKPLIAISRSRCGGWLVETNNTDDALEELDEAERLFASFVCPEWIDSELQTQVRRIDTTPSMIASVLHQTEDVLEEECCVMLAERGLAYMKALTLDKSEVDLRKSLKLCVELRAGTPHRLTPLDEAKIRH